MPSVTGRISRSPICISGSGESISIIEPKSRLAMPADREQAVAGHLDLEDEQREAQHDQQHAGVADRQHLQREEREQQADAARDAREDAPGLHNSIVSPSVPSVSSR